MQFAFDPTYGYDEAALRAVQGPPIPGDFEAFWRQNYELARSVPTNPIRRLVRETARLKIHELEFDAWDINGPRRLGGWMTTPRDGVISGGLVVGHGYGGRTGPEFSPLIGAAAIIYPCARGFNRSASPDIPGVADQHVLHGIRSRETYVHRGCAIDLWAAARAMAELEPQSANRIGYYGQSFGGGIGALALPWEPMFKRAFLDYPSFGNHPLRVTLPCIGSGEAIRRSGGAGHLPVLQYFDAAVAARFVRIPVMVGAALYDPAVPPPGQFAVFNGLGGEKELVIRQTAHVNPEASAEDVRIRRRAAEWLILG